MTDEKAKSAAGQIAALKKLSTGELRVKHQEVFGEPTKSKDKAHLLRKISHHLQEKTEGGSSGRAKAHSAEEADESPVPTKAPRKTKTAGEKEAKPRDPRLPAPGSVITKEYKGKTLNVTVAEDGFEFEGEMHRSLSAVAKKATGGMSINGFLFFGLIQRPGAEATAEAKGESRTVAKDEQTAEGKKE